MEIWKIDIERDYCVIAYAMPLHSVHSPIPFKAFQSLFICNPNNRAIIFHSDKFFYLCNQGVEEEIGSAEEQPISNKLLDDMQ